MCPAAEKLVPQWWHSTHTMLLGSEKTGWFASSFSMSMSATLMKSSPFQGSVKVGIIESLREIDSKISIKVINHWPLVKWIPGRKDCLPSKCQARWCWVKALKILMKKLLWWTRHLPEHTQVKMFTRITQLNFNCYPLWHIIQINLYENINCNNDGNYLEKGYSYNTKCIWTISVALAR